MNASTKITNEKGEDFGNPAQTPSSHQFTLDDVPDLTGKVALVTGGSEGIGYGTTWTFLRHNVHKLYLLCASPEIVPGAREAIANELGQVAADRTIWKHCDMADWKRVEQVAEEIKRDTHRLDILVNNAGRGVRTYQETEYGVDRHMAVNHFGLVVLTLGLLPLLEKTAEGGNTVRITVQASNLHRSAPEDTKFESLEELNRDLGPDSQFGRSKLAGILYARWFARHVTEAGHPTLLMNATHPGSLDTESKQDIHEPYPLAGYGMIDGMKPSKKSQLEGAVSTVYAATVTGRSGQYINSPAVPEAGSDQAQDEKLGDNLMELTRKVYEEKMREEPSPS
ncbi:hypothetical protein V5O48_018497 [Marasmius crinis-equi]|uniref:NAD(P)-binding protein n=1 Tax=Marasmius crinis-equi TaxID=585013 RepID=A0ABR3EL12_9AGAR